MKTNKVVISSEVEKSLHYRKLQTPNFKLQTLLVFLLLSISASSQSFYGGLALGGVTSQVDGDNNNGFHKIGFTAGAFVGHEISDYFEVQFEIKYIQKGSSSSSGDPVQFKIQLDYVELPLVASMNLGFFNINGHELNWISIEGGASVDVLAYTNQKNNGANEGSNHWKRLCVNGILGLKFNIIEKKLQIGARVITSINSAYAGNLSPETAYRFGQWGAFNDVLEIVAYYRF